MRAAVEKQAVAGINKGQELRPNVSAPSPTNKKSCTSHLVLAAYGFAQICDWCTKHARLISPHTT
ncbi:unnamed protein product [Laminaria digitata]